MTKIDAGIDVSGGRTAGSSFLIIVGLVFAGFFIGQFFAAMVSFVLAIMGGASFEALGEDPNSLYDYLSISQVLITQALYTLVFTFITPWFYLRIIAKEQISIVSNERGAKPLLIVVTALAAFFFMFINAFFVEWNANVDLPDFMGGFERWAQDLEAQLADATERFTTFENFGQFLLGFTVIAILPGIGEELLFRGVVQNGLHKVSKNAHIAIWGSAFLFAAIHLQFYGLVPRMLLGALFGYLYVWSGNIWYPIIAHAVNNGVGVVVVYMAQIGVTDLDIDETESVPMMVNIAAVALFVILMFFFRKHYLQAAEKDD